LAVVLSDKMWVLARSTESVVTLPSLVTSSLAHRMGCRCHCQ